MALDPKFATAIRNAMLDTLTDNCNSGYVRIYDGTKPANANTAVTTQNVLAECVFGSPSFGSASSGTLTANAITADTSANATGTATWFRVFESDGTTAVMDGTVGTSTSDMVITTTSIVSGATVSISSFTVSISA